MSNLGFVMLCHTALDRAAQTARHLASRDCPVVIHVDRRVGDDAFRAMQDELAGLPNVRFSKRHSCEWGTWSLVAASQAAASLMLREFIKVRHVYLASGACLPLRPVEELREFLADRPRTDFIESVTTEDVDWTVGGLAEERFRLRFPFSWKRQRWLFDRTVELQRRLKLTRRIPRDLSPHLGSQWWCLTRQTLSAILQDPRRAEFERYFRRVWIPDESYFQTLARRYATQLESRSLTLSKFDHTGKPHVFYDDHLRLLRQSDCFMARKIWPQADGLYSAFLNRRFEPELADGAPPRIDRIFDAARERRRRGRRGLYMAGRFPRQDWETGRTAEGYTVCHGFDLLFAEFPRWLSRRAGLDVHGHLFDRERVEFCDGRPDYAGGLSASASLRDYNPGQFLTNLIWNTQGTRQVFQFAPQDRQELVPFMAGDANASFWVISGAWAVPLYHSNMNFEQIRKEAARLQRIELAYLETLRGAAARADLHLWSLSEFLMRPMENLQQLLDHVAGPVAPRLTEAPRMADLTGFEQFVSSLKNQGMNPHLVGELAPLGAVGQVRPKGRPYLVK